jgi:hypothetical protein
LQPYVSPDVVGYWLLQNYSFRKTEIRFCAFIRNQFV